MSDPKTDPKLNQKLSLIARHLRVESAYLDTVIESSLEMQLILRERRSPTVSEKSMQIESDTDDRPSTISIQAERAQRLNQRMVKLRVDVEQGFLPIAEGRRQLVSVLRTIDEDSERTPTLSELAMRVEEPLKSELKAMRNEIRGKLNQVHSISMGNQAVLLYTLDFYNRLLSGLSTDDRQSNYYNANGQSQNHIAGSLVQTKC